MKFLQIAGRLINADRIEAVQRVKSHGSHTVVIEVRGRDRPIIHQFGSVGEADEWLKDLVYRLDGEVIDLLQPIKQQTEPETPVGAVEVEPTPPGSGQLIAIQSLIEEVVVSEGLGGLLGRVKQLGLTEAQAAELAAKVIKMAPDSRAGLLNGLRWSKEKGLTIDLLAFIQLLDRV